MTSKSLVPTLISGTLTLLLVACASSKESGTGSAVIQHVVLCWLKTPGDEEARRELIDASYTLESIPGVVRVHAGTAHPSERPVVDDSFDIGIVIVLENAAALSAYLEHPTHKRLIGNVLQPLTERVLIYDIIE